MFFFVLWSLGRFPKKCLRDFQEGTIWTKLYSNIHWKEIIELQLISYKRYLECTLIQWRLSIYPWVHRYLWVPFSWNPLYVNKDYNQKWIFSWILQAKYDRPLTDCNSFCKFSQDCWIKDLVHLFEQKVVILCFLKTVP